MSCWQDNLLTKAPNRGKRRLYQAQHVGVSVISTQNRDSLGPTCPSPQSSPRIIACHTRVHAVGETPIALFCCALHQGSNSLTPVYPKTVEDDTGSKLNHVDTNCSFSLISQKIVGHLLSVKAWNRSGPTSLECKTASFLRDTPFSVNPTQHLQIVQ